MAPITINSLLALAVTLAAVASEGMAAELIAKPWQRGAGPADTSTWVGANYTPEYASNQIQMWRDFRADVIERELAAARRIFGISTLRVFLHHMVYDAEKETLLERIEQFLQICDRHGIRPGFVFFDDCHTRKDIGLEPLEPIKGRHNARWAPLQDVDRKEENFPAFKNFVQDIVRPYRNDPRVLWWETYNEPNKGVEFSEKLRALCYDWIMACQPDQPVLSCWLDNPYTEIVDVHKYIWGGWDHYANMNPAKGAFFTEAGARWTAPKPSNGEPCEVIHWLNQRKASGRTVPGVMLCWELMIGNSNCRWRQGLPVNSPEPVIPWHGLLWPDCTPYSLAEAEAIRQYTTGERRAMIYENFQDPLPGLPTGWTEYGQGDARVRIERIPKMETGICILPPDHRVLAGEAGWTDYVMEATVMLRTNHGHAGFIIRADDAQQGGVETMPGYYVGIAEGVLKLDKLGNGAKSLATFDTRSLECQAGPEEWNHLRVAVEGNRIRVWFNRMHPSADPANGLRIDVVDKESPLLAGRIGLRTVHGEAWFDNVVVLPFSALD